MNQVAFISCLRSQQSQIMTLGSLRTLGLNTPIRMSNGIRVALPRTTQTCTYTQRHLSTSLPRLAKAEKTNPYTSTILLPKTEFPLRADAAKREHAYLDRCTKDLYPWQV
ncbi:hypothetical protein J3Q64DRAFT_1740520, partial [Phycomyces blakesleeanus]